MKLTREEQRTYEELVASVCRDLIKDKELVAQLKATGASPLTDEQMKQIVAGRAEMQALKEMIRKRIEHG